MLRARTIFSRRPSIVRYFIATLRNTVAKLQFTDRLLLRKTLSLHVGAKILHDKNLQTHGKERPFGKLNMIRLHLFTALILVIFQLQTFTLIFTGRAVTAVCGG